MRSSISYGNGMYKSTDGGKTWTHIRLEDSRQIGRILVDPRDPNRVFCCGAGSCVRSDAERGVFVRKMAERAGKKFSFTMKTQGRSIWHSSRGIRKTIYAALWQTRRPPWSIYPPSNGAGSGLYRSMTGAIIGNT